MPGDSPISAKRPRYLIEDPLGGNEEAKNKYIQQLGGAVEVNKKFKMCQAKSVFLIENIPTNPEELLLKLFEYCIHQTVQQSEKEGIGEPDHIGVTISSVLLNPDIWIPLRPINENTAEAILNRFLLVAQSKTQEGAGNLWGESFTITVTALNKYALPRTRQICGRGRPKLLTRKQQKQQKQQEQFSVPHQINRRAMIEVNNRDNFCLFYALELTRIVATKEMNKNKLNYYLTKRLAPEKRHSSPDECFRDTAKFTRI